MEELWMNINGYEGLYQISNLGQVKSFQKGKERILNPRVHNDGYLIIDLCNNGRKKTHKVHKLVAEHFVPGYQEGLDVNHIDEDKTNNIWTNLEWLNHRDNNNHGDRIRKAVQTRAANKGKTIYCIELNRTFSTQVEAANFIGCSRELINKCLSGTRKTAKGYTFIYR